MTSEFSERSAVSEHSDVSVISVISVISEALSVEQLLTMTQPQKMGQRNACIYRLARGLKFNSGPRHQNGAKWKAVVRAWHENALPVIGTRNFDETWADFLRAYLSALLPLGASLDEWALERAKESLPPAADGYETERIKLLVGICWHLATLSPQQRFFLSSHRVGELLAVSQSTAMDYLRMLCTDAVIQVIERGNQRVATRYRYVAKGVEGEAVIGGDAVNAGAFVGNGPTIETADNADSPACEPGACEGAG
jgi:hypothetical protein